MVIKQDEKEFNMKYLLTFVFITLTLCFICILISCGEYGGTIVVKNNYPEDKTVTVYSDVTFSGPIFTYKDKYGPKNIITGSTGNFSVDSNTHYGIIWSHDGVDKYEVVEVSNGATIKVNIPKW
jgi:hypothetical protein